MGNRRYYPRKDEKMKHFKKVMALLLATVMVLAMGTTALAADTYKITIDNAVAGETYSAYKVFDVTYADVDPDYQPPEEATDVPGDPDPTHQHLTYSYTISVGSRFWTDLITGVTPDEEGVYTLANYGLKFVPTTTTGVYNVVPANDFVTEAQAQALAAFLATKLDGKTPDASDEASADTHNHDDYATGSLELDVTSAGAGYYFVDTTTGSLCSLDTTEPSATIREKNSIPTAEKKVSDAENGTYSEETTIQIGDFAYFEIDVTDSKGTDKAITVHDKMDAALTLDTDSFEVTVDGTDVPEDNYTIKTTGLTDGCTFEVELKADYVKTLEEDTVVKITFRAELNKNAVTEDPFQTNKTHLTYSHQSTEKQTVTVKTHEVDVVKTDANKKLLDGATFKLYDASTGGNAYNLVKVEDGKYRLADSTDTAYAEKLEPKNGKLTIVGLENTTYYLEEVDHPAGYNPLTARKDIVVNGKNNHATIDGDTYKEGGVQVINQAGSELPSTGGIGTTIFYVVGAVLVIGAGVLLVSRRRMR